MNLYQIISRRILAITSLFLLTLVLTVAMQAQSSSVDLSFNATPTRESGYVGNFVFQPDGKILIFNGLYDAFILNGVAKSQIARLNSDGNSDDSFDCAACDFRIQSAVVQPDGKIVVAGSALSTVSGLYPAIVKRLNSDGSIDNSFASPFAAPPPPAGSRATVWAIQPDGKIIVSTSTLLQGFFSYFSQGSASYTIYRLNLDGSFDNTFTTIASSSGNTILNYVTKIALQTDSKILVSSSNSVRSQSVGRIQRYNTDGTTDTTFEGPTLTARVNFSEIPIFTRRGKFSNSTTIHDFDIQPDGKIVFVGRFATVNAVERVNIARLLPNGDVDLSFAPANIFPSTEEVTRVKVLSNSQILIGNYKRIFRFNSDGSVDNTFNAPSNLSSIGKWDVDAAGKILLSGGFLENSSNPSKFVRLNPDGSLDSSFKEDFDAPGTIQTFAIQPDGKIIVYGFYFPQINGVPQKLARLNPDGSLDSTFNPGTRFEAVSISKILIQSDGKILIIVNSYSGSGGNTLRSELVRLNPDGSQDTSFSTIVNSSVSAIALQADGKILIGGSFTIINGTQRTGAARLNADGSLDTSFNPLFDNRYISSLDVQADGKIMVGGLFFSVNGFSRKNIARLNADGTLDSSFDPNVNEIYYSIDEIEIQPDGKYVILVSKNKLVRLNNDGTMDTSFQSSNFGSNGGAPSVYAMLVEPDGSIIVGGYFTTVNGVLRSNIVRFKPNGSLDTTFLPDGANNFVYTISRQPDGKIIISGNFTRVDGVIRIGIARLIVVPFQPDYAV